MLSLYSSNTFSVPVSLLGLALISTHALEHHVETSPLDSSPALLKTLAPRLPFQKSCHICCDHGLSEFLLTQVYHSFKINACICFTDLFFLQLLQLEGFFFLSVCCKCPVACPLVFLLSFVHVLLKPFCWGILWAALIGTTTPDMFPVYCSEKLENANFRAIYGACLLWFPTDDE